ncbi:hypothetical protein [Rhizobium sp. JAB6]|uniref:hypothetical protein n=1 Tax=Rhizobium sp. JAB6 TaxID=2127050 RepID=UPI001FDF4296|nr:hypothetical protein [Rhizobium sp. JAB6]
MSDEIFVDMVGFHEDASFIDGHYESILSKLGIGFAPDCRSANYQCILISVSFFGRPGRQQIVQGFRTALDRLKLAERM